MASRWTDEQKNQYREEARGVGASDEWMDDFLSRNDDDYNRLAEAYSLPAGSHGPSGGGSTNPPGGGSTPPSSAGGGGSSGHGMPAPAPGGWNTNFTPTPWQNFESSNHIPSWSQATYDSGHKGMDLFSLLQGRALEALKSPGQAPSTGGIGSIDEFLQRLGYKK